MSDTVSPWSVTLRLGEVQRAPPTLALQADAITRAAIARTLDLLELKRFIAQAHVRPWLDGVEVRARWEADIVQACGVSLEPFDTALSGTFTVRAVPEDSPAAGDASPEITIDPDAEDPPDLLDGDQVDLGAYLVEHLALDVDPFPRKPGAAFEAPPAETSASPFAVLKALNPPADP